MGEKVHEDDRMINLLCDLEECLEDEYNAQEMDILKSECTAQLDKWETLRILSR